MNCLNSIELSYRAELRDLFDAQFGRFEEKLERRLSETKEELRREIGSVRAELASVTNDLHSIKAELGSVKDKLGLLGACRRAVADGVGADRG